MPKKDENLVNDNVRFPEVLVIDPNGEQLGVMSSREANRRAEEFGLDLLCVAPKATPPVCRILDYGKFKFQAQKKQREAKRNQHIVVVKEVQLTPLIGDHDMQTKAKQAIKFLEEGNKLKVGVRFRGRQLAHPEIGQETLEKFLQLVSAVGTLEKPAVMEGKWLNCNVAPISKKN